MSIRINALPADKLLMFDGVRRFLPNQSDPDRLIFEGSFIEYGSVSGGRDFREQRKNYRIPLSFMSMFNTRSHWRDQMSNSHGQMAKILKLKNERLRADQLTYNLIHNFADSEGIERQGHLLTAAEAETFPTGSKLNWLGKAKAGRVQICWDEFIRFYLCNFGMLFYDILKCAQDGGSLAHLCYTERTRIVDRTLYVAPRHHIRDRGSILQLGMIVADAALRQEIFRIARFVAGDAHGFGSGPYIPRFPEGTDKLYVQYADGFENMKGDRGTRSAYKSITKIRSDYRPAMFDEIIAELTGEEYEPSEPSSDEQEVQDIVRSFADEELLTWSQLPGGKHTVSAPLPWQNFRDGYPGYRNVKVQLLHQNPPRLVPAYIPSLLEPIEHREATDSTSRSETGPARLSRSSRIWIDPGPAEKSVLAAADKIEAPSPVWVNPSRLSSRLRTFWQAADELGGTEHRAGGQAICYQMPGSWGSFAQLKGGGSRLFMYTMVTSDLGSAYAVEMDREFGGLRTSIGIMAKQDGVPMTPQEVFACVKSAVGHVSQRDRHVDKFVRLQSIWPNALVYNDVCSTSLKHYKRFSEVDLFANAIETAATNLFIYR